jgi:hypothetical protein
MELRVNHKSTANPSAADVAQAIDATPHPERWYLVLDSDDGSYVDAAARPDGKYHVTASDGARDLQANGPLEANRVKEILLRFLAGDAGWRDMGFSPVPDLAAKEGSAAAARAGSSLPPWALAIIVGAIALVVLVATLPVRAFLPFADSDYFYVALIASPVVVLLIVATLARMLEVRRASTWSMAAGRIVRSDTQARRHRFAGDATTVTTVPVVEYEFSAGGRTWHGSRIGIGDDSGGANIEETLRHYPVGTAVSVYYDPGNPKNCVLERDIPAGVRKGLVILVAFGIAIAVGVYYIVTSAPSLLSAYLPEGNDNAPFVIAIACFGLLVLLFAFASYRSSRKAADWPMVRGTVLSSGSERVQKRASGRTQTHYVPVVEYGYRVNDVDYVSRQIKLGVVLSADQAYATRVAGRYPQGSGVDVHYDPANPSNAALENPRGFHWLLLAVALGCFAAAAYAAGVI